MERNVLFTKKQNNIVMNRKGRIFCVQFQRKNILCTISNEINGILAREGDKRDSSRHSLKANSIGRQK